MKACGIKDRTRNLAAALVFGLNMNPQTKLPDSVPPSAARGRRTALRLAVAAAGIFLPAITILFVITASPSQKVVWLTSANLTRSGQTGLFTGLKQKVARLMPQFVWRFWWSQPQINIDSNLLTIPAEAAKRTGLGASAATNAGGMRAWILSPAQLKTFRQQLKTLSGVESLGSPRVTILDGRQVRVSVGSPVQVAGKVTPVGLTVDLTPKVVSGAIRLIVESHLDRCGLVGAGQRYDRQNQPRRRLPGVPAQCRRPGGERREYECRRRKKLLADCFPHGG